MKCDWKDNYSNTGYADKNGNIEQFIGMFKDFNDARDKWDKYFLEIAETVSRKSKDPSTKVGAVIVDEDKRVISVGYNGFPKGIKDTQKRLNNRELKYKLVIHGEINAILFASRSVKDCSLYCFPFMCCSSCALLVIQSGIKKVIAPYSENPRWVESFRLTRELFKEAGVDLKEIKNDYREGG